MLRVILVQQILREIAALYKLEIIHALAQEQQVETTLDQV